MGFADRAENYLPDGSVKTDDLGFCKVGNWNPVLMRVNGEKAIYLLYDSLREYIASEQRCEYVAPPGSSQDLIEILRKGYYEVAERMVKHNYIDGRYEFMDDVTRMFRNRDSAQHYSLGIEYEGRQSFVNHPYIVAVADGNVLGGVWQEDHYAPVAHQKTRLRIRKFHMSILRNQRKQGIGSELISVYEEYAKNKGEDGVRTFFDDDQKHTGSEHFFKARDYVIQKYNNPDRIEAIKVFQ